MTPALPPLAPEAAANGGSSVPERAPTHPHPERLWDGHLSAECSVQGGGAPACPACLGAALPQLRRD
ncbi:MAG TPA: hypothetical protein VH134_04680 [Candidatus Dormibacteraeota bacterium]|jgi:hypothetical protein|nr:hypothetical protein [Candidatus Dormibacteraeota bacterium]